MFSHSPFASWSQIMSDISLLIAVSNNMFYLICHTEATTAKADIKFPRRNELFFSYSLLYKHTIKHFDIFRQLL